MLSALRAIAVLLLACHPLVGCDGQPVDPPTSPPPGGARVPGARIDGQGAVDIGTVWGGSAAQQAEIRPGVRCPQAYGVGCWSDLVLRIDGNIAKQRGDQARVASLRGESEQVRQLTALALGSRLSLPRSIDPASLSAGPVLDRCLHLDQLDSRPVPERLAEQVAAGWFGPEAWAYLGSHLERVELAFNPETLDPWSESLAVRAALWQLAAEREEQAGHTNRSVVLAAKACEAWLELAERSLAPVRTGGDLRFPGEFWELWSISDDLHSPRFAWGKLSAEHTLSRLVHEAAQAARVARSEELHTRVAALQAEAAALSERQRSLTVPAGVRWVQPRGLGRVPT